MDNRVAWTYPPPYGGPRLLDRYIPGNRPLGRPAAQDLGAVPGGSAPAAGEPASLLRGQRGIPIRPAGGQGTGQGSVRAGHRGTAGLRGSLVSVAGPDVPAIDDVPTQQQVGSGVAGL